MHMHPSTPIPPLVCVSSDHSNCSNPSANAVLQTPDVYILLVALNEGFFQSELLKILLAWRWRLIVDLKIRPSSAILQLCPL